MKTKTLFFSALLVIFSFSAKAQWQDVGVPDNTMIFAGSPDIAIHPTTGAPYVSFGQIFPPLSLYGTSLTAYDGFDWNYIGAQNFSSGAAYYVNLEFNPNTHEPYLAFADETESQAATVMKYDGTSWSIVGAAGFSADTVRGISLSFHPVTYEPYVAFTPKGDGYKISVMKYDGSNWVYVGTQAFSANDGAMAAIEFNPLTNEPYVTYYDNTLGVVVQKFDGTSWVNLPAFPNPSSAILDAEFSPTGEIHVFFSDYQNGKKGSVAKFDGTDWSYVGTEGFTTGATPGMTFLQGEALAFTTSGTPFIALRDDVDDNSSTADSLIVMTFNGTAWEMVGDAVLTATNFGFSIAVSANDEPYVVYTDEASNAVTYVKKHGASVVIAPAQPTNLTVTPAKRQAFDKMQLAWTDNANNEDGFQIERSIDNAVWDIIDSLGVDASSYLDTGLIPETTYFYRVLAFNSAGASSYSNIDSANTGTITAIQPKTIQNELAVYPNPAQTVFYFNNALTEKLESIVLIDILGKQIRSFEENTTYNIEGINSGVYWILITTPNQHYKQKLIIQ